MPMNVSDSSGDGNVSCFLCIKSKNKTNETLMEICKAKFHHKEQEKSGIHAQEIPVDIYYRAYLIP